MTRFNYIIDLIRGKLSCNLMSLSFFIMPEGPIKDTLLADMEKTLDKIILDSDNYLNKMERS